MWLQNRSDETAGNKSSHTNLRNTSNHRGKWVHNTLGFFPFYILRGLSIFCLKVFCKFQEIYPQTHTRKWPKMFTEHWFYFWLKKTTFLTRTFLPSSQQHKFLLSCGLSSTYCKSWKSFNNRSGLTSQKMITDTRSVLRQINGSCHWALKK